MKRQSLRNVSKEKALRGWLKIEDSFFDDQQKLPYKFVCIFFYLCYDWAKTLKATVGTISIMKTIELSLKFKKKLTLYDSKILVSNLGISDWYPRMLPTELLRFYNKLKFV